MKHGRGGYASGCRCDECREAHRSYMRAYYATNRERLLKRKAEHYQEHRERLDADHAEWRAANRERDNELSRLRHARDAEAKNTRRRELYVENHTHVRERTRLKRARRRAILSRYKTMIGCTGCGWKGPPRFLDFHHRDPTTKTFNIGERFHHETWAAIKTEVAKCDVLCRVCHALVHRPGMEESA